MKKLFPGALHLVTLLAVMLFTGMAAHAVPAKPGLRRQLTLTDGTTVNAHLVGDEFGHYWIAEDGRAYQSIDGNDRYSPIDRQSVNERAKARRNAANKQRVKRLMPKTSDSFGRFIGQKKGLIILVNFKDVSFKTANNQAYYERIANEKDFYDGDFRGSMHDYFYAQSGKQFELTFDVAGPYTVSKNRSYYGSNDSQGDDKYPAQMIIEAVKMADEDVDFSDYDWSGDGYVDQVYVIYAGQGEADSGISNTIWPHAFTLTEAKMIGDGSGKQKLDGVYIDTYACGSELNGEKKIDGIGTMCHEFSHCLGYPDFYDTDYSGGQGMSYWDLMDSGCYNGNGYRPAGYTAYERWTAGWIEPIELTSAQRVEGMNALADGGDAYIIYNKGNNNEFFILENRQFVGWDDALPGAGLLIVHGDYDATAWTNNQPNDDPNHQRMTWIAADNKYQYEMYEGTKYYTWEGLTTDTYPQGNVNAFGKNTTPAAKLYNKNSDGTYYLDTSVEDITQHADGTISFRYVAPSNIPAPTFSPKSGRYAEPQTVTISSTAEGAAIYFTTDGTDPTTASTLYTESITISETTTLKAIAVVDDEQSDVATALFIIAAESGNTFKRVASTSDLVSGMRYIIACGSKAKAAGEASGSYLVPVDVTVETDTITINDDVAVFFVEGDNDNGWTFLNELTGDYLCSTRAKSLSYTNNDPSPWTLSDGTDGVVMTFHLGDLNFGTMLYNATSPRFNIYTSKPTTSMIQANLYVEFKRGSAPVVTKQDVTLTFSSDHAEAVVGQEFTAPSLTIEPAGADIAVTFGSSNENVATVDATSGAVAIVDEGTAIITATFEGNDGYNAASASYTLTVTKATDPDDPTIVPTDGRYDLVTDDTTLTQGDSLLIAYIDETGMALVLGKTQNMNNRSAVTATINDDATLTPDNTAQVIVLEEENGTFRLSVDEGYLYAASSNKNWLRTEAEADDNALASITIDGDGNATIAFLGENTRNQLRFNANNGTPIFSCYATTSSIITLPRIYRKITAEIDPDNPTTGIVLHDGGNTTGDSSGYYTIDGRRVNTASRLAKGLYIVNGKKMLQK